MADKDCVTVHPILGCALSIHVKNKGPEKGSLEWCHRTTYLFLVVHFTYILSHKHIYIYTQFIMFYFSQSLKIIRNRSSGQPATWCLGSSMWGRFKGTAVVPLGQSWELNPCPSDHWGNSLTPRTPAAPFFHFKKYVVVHLCRGV